MSEAQEAAVYASMGKPVPNPRMDDLRIGRRSTKKDNGPWGKHKLFEIVFDIKQSLKKRRSELVIPVNQRVFPIGEHPLIPIQELQPWECFDAARVSAIIAKCIQLLQENNYEAGPDMRLFMDPESVRLITDGRRPYPQKTRFYCKKIKNQSITFFCIPSKNSLSPWIENFVGMPHNLFEGTSRNLSMVRLYLCQNKVCRYKLNCFDGIKNYSMV